MPTRLIDWCARHAETYLISESDSSASLWENTTCGSTLACRITIAVIYRLVLIVGGNQTGATVHNLAIRGLVSPEQRTFERNNSHTNSYESPLLVTRWWIPISDAILNLKPLLLLMKCQEDCNPTDMDFFVPIPMKKVWRRSQGTFPKLQRTYFHSFTVIATLGHEIN